MLYISQIFDGYIYKMDISTKDGYIYKSFKLSANTFSNNVLLQAVEQITAKTLDNYEAFLGKVEEDKKSFIC